MEVVGLTVPLEVCEATWVQFEHLNVARLERLAKGEKYDVPDKLPRGLGLTLGAYVASELSIANTTNAIEKTLGSPALFWSLAEQAVGIIHPSKLVYDGTDPRAATLADWTGYAYPYDMGSESVSGFRDAGGKETALDKLKKKLDTKSVKSSKKGDDEGDDSDEMPEEISASGSSGDSSDDDDAPAKAKGKKALDVSAEAKKLVKNCDSSNYAEDYKMAKKDIKAMGLGAFSVLNLEMSIEVCKVVTKEQMKGMAYRGNVATTPYAIKLRKAGHTMMTKVIADKDFGKWTMMMMRLAETYSERGLYMEAVRINRFFSNVQTIMPKDRMWAYLVEYRTKYEGRALPVVDTDASILVRIQQQDLSADQKVSKATYESGMSSMRAEVARAIAAMEKAKNAKDSGGGGGGNGGGGKGGSSRDDARKGGKKGNMVCWNCGEEGHARHECPHPLKDKGKGKADDNDDDE